MASRVGLAIVVLAAGASCENRADAPVDHREAALAADVRIAKVSLYQGVEKNLYKGPGVNIRGVVSPPIVLGREATVRIAVEAERPLSWVPRQLAVVMSYRDSEFETLLSEVVLAEGDWSDGALDTTIQFRIPPERVTQDMVLEVSVHELSGAAAPLAPDAPQRWSSETTGLDFSQSDTLSLHVFPIQYDADGSGRVPDTGPERLAEIREKFLAMYPVQEVNIVVEQRIPWNTPISASGAGWGEVLTEMSSRRAAATDIPENSYFYALFDPVAEAGAYCPYGCILGLSLVPPSASDTWARASIGVGYGRWAVDTMLHEVGHAHGRQHAPCDVPQADPEYPYQGGGIGSFGFDLGTQELAHPDAHADFMGYCTKSWVSDYTFDALLQRVKVLRTPSRSAKTDWQMLTVGADGTATLGDVVRQSVAPASEIAPFDLRDAEGKVVGRTQGYFLPFDHIDGGLALIPPAGAGVVSATLVP